MSFTLRILGWEATGLRCPDHSVSLVDQRNRQVFPVTLVQMPNGTGKTTTLTLLRAALSGTPPTIDQIRELAPLDGGVKKGKFVVEIALEDQRRTFELTLDYPKATAHYRTTLRSGIRDGHDLDPELAKILTPEFIRFFVFDGELAHGLLDPNQPRAQDALDALFQVSLLKQISDALEAHWEQRASEAAMKGKRAVTQRKYRWQELTAHLKKLNAEREKLRGRKSDIGRRLDELEGLIAHRVGADKRAKQALERARSERDKAIAEAEKALATAFQDAYSPQSLSAVFAKQLMQLKHNLDKVKLPSTTSKEFFLELAQGDECVCGAKLSDASRAAIRTRAPQYLGSGFHGVLNAVKEDVAHYVEGRLDRHQETFDAEMKTLESAIRLRDERIAKFDQVRTAGIEGAGGEAVENSKEQTRLGEELKVIEERLRVLASEPKGDDELDKDCIEAIEEKATEAEEDYNRAAETFDLRRRTVVVQAVLDTAQEDARAAFSKRLTADTNERLLKLLPRAPVKLSSVGSSVALSKQGNASVGQVLAISYAFLSSLFNHADQKLPFIVDSPVGSLDIATRRHVAQVIPRFFGQFVAFTLSSEREGFLAPLEAASEGAIQYLTMFRRTRATERLLQDVPKKVVQLTESGALVTGREFFMEFDVEEEERA